MKKRLYRFGKERIIGGVCGGIAEYLDMGLL
jgi:phage shock protein PspC (stress-responsive transcriptional regulator)